MSAQSKEPWQSKTGDSQNFIATGKHTAETGLNLCLYIAEPIFYSV
jgi:hypothetical protein